MMVKCELCGRVKGITTRGKKMVFHRHHIDYEKDLTILLCYTCHSSIHLRCRFGNPWEFKHGKDKGFYELAKKFIKVYEDCIGNCTGNCIQA